MGTRVFSFDITIRPQISTFNLQILPESHRACLSGRRRLKNLRPSLQPQKSLAVIVKCGGDRTEVKQKDDGILMEEDDIVDDDEKVELMEMEAIMGKDDGKEPMDYKRRAGIFYKSSEMFQANKNPPHHHHHHHHSTQK